MGYQEQTHTELKIEILSDLFCLIYNLYLPIQNLLNILSKTDSVTSSPVISPNA